MQQDFISCMNSSDCICATDLENMQRNAGQENLNNKALSVLEDRTMGKAQKISGNSKILGVKLVPCPQAIEKDTNQ